MNKKYEGWRERKFWLPKKKEKTKLKSKGFELERRRRRKRIEEKKRKKRRAVIARPSCTHRGIPTTNDGRWEGEVAVVLFTAHGRVLQRAAVTPKRISQSQRVWERTTTTTSRYVYYIYRYIIYRRKKMRIRCISLNVQVAGDARIFLPGRFGKCLEYSVRRASECETMMKERR